MAGSVVQILIGIALGGAGLVAALWPAPLIFWMARQPNAAELKRATWYLPMVWLPSMVVGAMLITLAVTAQINEDEFKIKATQEMKQQQQQQQQQAADEQRH